MEERRATRELEKEGAQPELRTFVVEASQALAKLDAGRLEELALSCEALNRDLGRGWADTEMRKTLAQQAREAAADMAVFARVLEATRANVNVMSRLREMRLGQLEYKVGNGAEAWAGPQAEGEHGDR
jgi:hypothetical protein